LPVKRDLRRRRRRRKYLRGDGGKVPGIRGVFRQNSFRRAFGDGDEGVDERHALCCVYYQRACGEYMVYGDSKGTFSLNTSKKRFEERGGMHSVWWYYNARSTTLLSKTHNLFYMLVYFYYCCLFTFLLAFQ